MSDERDPALDREKAKWLQRKDVRAEDAEEARQRLAAAGLLPSAEESLSPAPSTPQADRMSRDRRERLAPTVRMVREHLFGDPSPPFSGEDDPRFVEWNSALMRGAIENWLSSLPADQVGGDPLDATDSEHRTRARQLSDAVDFIAGASGFSELAVRRWIMFGENPKLERLKVWAGSQRELLPDGSFVRRAYATLTIHAPVSERELVDVWRRHLRPVWSDEAIPADVTHEDLHLVELMEEHGVPGPASAPVIWDEILRLWKQTPPEGVSPDAWQSQPGQMGNVKESAIRARWARLKKKWPEVESTIQSTRQRRRPQQPASAERDPEDG